MMGLQMCRLLASYIADAQIPSKGAENKALREAIAFNIGLVFGGPSHARVVPAIEAMRADLGAALTDPKNPYPGNEEATAGWLLNKKDSGP